MAWAYIIELRIMYIMLNRAFENTPILARAVLFPVSCAELARIVDQGGVKPLLDDQTFSLSEVGKAHDRLTSGQAIGRGN